MNSGNVAVRMSPADAFERSIQVTIGDVMFDAELDFGAAPRTCAHFLSLLPYEQRIIHARWSGEAAWIPLGNAHVALPAENATSYPAPGEFLFFPGGVSETEILLAYGPARFASKAGQLAGNPFLRLTAGLDHLPALGRDLLWTGAKDIHFSRRRTGRD